MTEDKSLIAARAAAAQYLRAQGYGADAAYVEAGQSDDTREVQIALALHKILYVAPTPPTKYKGRRLVGEEC
ncbi:hypothetical protein [Novosphingobium humi]|uniref:hypothetical protein n=1 Tax=Novosphingobium humi TaxID=2282397 RepID=UPI0025B03932|nr:hypothetical protein [Novosphingobium humi]WJT01123.1 hypothetical protein NYQ05_20800 [Novosphingobium humi]